MKLPEHVSLFDTKTRSLCAVTPNEEGIVGIYACGPTVYAPIHIGNARPFVVFSLLKRFLQRVGYRATLVINITDINDKIYVAAHEHGLESQALAEQMAARYIADTDKLALGRPDHEPLASETMAEIVNLISVLIERGHAYAVDGDVYFRVRSDASYGVLSARALDQMDQGEGLEGANLKEDPLDFALWKAQKTGEDSAWPSPWGRGRPGWHIECSAMAEALLGTEFSIHGGGNDLIFPHHENEAAQTRGARGAELAKIWMHNGMLQFGGEKMAKSVGNILSLADALERYGRDTLILFFCSAHYRQPILFDDATLAHAKARLTRLRELARRLVDGPSPLAFQPLCERFFTALADDFNTPMALAALAEWVRAANSATEPVGREDLVSMLDVLGLANLLEVVEDEVDERAELLFNERQAARKQRDFARADALRKELSLLGWEVRDTPDGAVLVRTQ